MEGKLARLIISLILLVAAGGSGLTRWLFSSQYNSNGISHFLVIAVDEDQPKEFIGRLDDHDIYLERLDADETYFRSVDAENVTLEEAFEGNLVSIDDWRKHARRTKIEADTEILIFENYEIAVTDDECVIRPRSR